MRREHRELPSDSYRASVLRDERDMGMDGGDGCTMIWKDLIPLNCTLKMDRMVNFMLYVFYHNKKGNTKRINFFVVCETIKMVKKKTTTTKQKIKTNKILKTCLC